MAITVKLAVISKICEEASLLRKLACISSSSLHSCITQPYIVSNTCYKLSIKVFYSSCTSNSDGI